MSWKKYGYDEEERIWIGGGGYNMNRMRRRESWITKRLNEYKQELQNYLLKTHETSHI